MKLRKALVLLLTLCMIVSIMAPAATAVQGVVSGADTKGNAQSGISQLGNGNAEGPLTLKDKLLAAHKEQGYTSTLASDALGRLKNETMEELARAAETFGPGEIVSAFVVMEQLPTSELYADINAVPTAETNRLLDAQTVVLNSIKDSLVADSTLEVRYQFTYLLNAFSIQTEFENLAKIAEIPGVASVFVMPEYQALSVEQGALMPLTSSSSNMTGVPSVWADLGYTGTGMRIAILDTGLDLDHPAFAAAPELTATSLRVEEIAKVLSGLNAYKMTDGQVTAEDLYYSDKIPFAFNYSDRNLNADHESDQQGDHGTHVAGIAGANCMEGVGYAGMAPDAQIIVMKVFGNQGSMMDGVIAALEDALLLNCDVVNMSLGSSAGFTSTSSIIDEVFARIQEQDMIAAIAAGNEYTSGLMNSWGAHINTTSNPDNATVDAPGTYINSTVVGSVNNNFSPAPYFTFGETMVGYRDTNGIPLFSTLSELGELEYVMIPGLGYPEDFEGIDVTGKIALVTRGTLNFYEKMQNAARAGAVGVLIVNNEPGSVANFGMDFTGVTAPVVPCVMISMETGAKMAAAEVKTMVVSAVEGMVPDELGGQMSEFTSWGVTPDLRLLPNLSGIGGNVMSTVDPMWTGEGGYYGLMSGTSMATPQVAGISALVLQYLREQFPDTTDAERRVLADALLMSTAVPVRNASAGVEASPRQQGSGLVNALGAITSGAYLSVPYDNYGSAKPQIELGDDPARNGVYTFSFSVNNMTNAPKTYTLSGSLLTEEVYEYGGQKFMDGTDRALTGTVEFEMNTVTVPANGTVKVQVTVTLSQEDKDWMNENFENGIYVEGYVYLTAEEGGVDLSLPYMGFFGNWNEAPIFDTGFWYDNSFWYDDAAPSQTMTWHIAWMDLGGTDWILGINPYATEYDEAMYNPANNVVSPNGDGVLDGLVDIYLSQLRNARNLHFTFTTEDGTLLNKVTYPFSKKTLYMLSYGQTVPTVYSWSGQPMYDYTDAEGNLLPDGTKVILTIQAETDYKSGGVDVNKYNTIQIPMTVDISAPVLENVEQIVSGGRNYVELTVSDVSSLAYVVLANATGSRYLDSQLDYTDFTRNADGTWTVLFDVTGFGSDMQVILCDYGANEGHYPIEFTAAENMPELEEGTLFGYRIYDSYWSSMGYYDYQYGWHAIDKDTSELTEWTADYMEYYAITAAEYAGGLVFAVDAGNNLLWMEPGLFNRYNIVNLGAYVIDMTFDETTNTMYALTKESVENSYGDEIDVMVLNTLDLLTGELVALTQYNMYADYYNPYNAPWCITDVNGELFVGLYESATIAKLDENFQIVPLVDYKEDYVELEEPTTYAQSMTYSAADNCIYWAHVGMYGTSTLLKIDMTYAEVNDFEMTQVMMPGEAEFVGLFMLEETEYTLPESAEVDEIVLSKTKLQLLAGASDVLTASPLPWNAPMNELTWSSADETIATVEDGVVTGIGEGTTTITVTDGKNTASCTVRVIEISGHIYGYNYYSSTPEGQMTYGTWFDLDLSNMDINPTFSSPIDFITADYNGHDGILYGYDEMGQFYAFNPLTGELETRGSAIGAANLPRDMAYDYENGIMYGIADGAEYGTLVTINLSNGQTTFLQEVMDAEYYGPGWFYEYETDEFGDYVFDEFGMPIMKVYPHEYAAMPSWYDKNEYYMTLAWSPEGLLAITNLGNLVHLVPALMVDYMYGTAEEVLAGVPIMSGLGYPQYYQSMAYDHANDKLVWASVENYSIMWMDPWDPAVVSLGLPQGLALFEFVGMYTIPENMPERPVIEVESVAGEDMMLVTGAVKPSPITVYPTNATNTVITYSSDNTAVATVDAVGNITAIAPGTATITVKVQGELDSAAETSFTVTVLEGGATIYSFLAGDLATNASQFWFWMEDSDPSNVDYRGAIEAELFYYSAEYCAETGLVYAYGFDPMDWSSSWYFVAMDPNDSWKVVEFKEMAQNFPFVYDLTYNYVEGVMYAVADVTDTSTDLYKVDLATGNLLPVMQLVNPDTGADMCVLGLAAAPDGKLYGIANSTVEYVFNWETWMEEEIVTDGMLYQFDVANGEIIPVGYTGFKHNSLGSMAFDMDTGNLYWASLYNGPTGYVSNLCLVDENTGAAVSLGAPAAAGAQLTGMYILADNYPECTAELSVIAEGKTVVTVGDVVNPTIITTGAVAQTVWTSGNTDILVVEADGTIKAVGAGFTTLTVTVTGEDGTTASASVGVSVIAQDAYFLAFNNKTNTWEKIDRHNPLNVTPVEGSTIEATLLSAENVNGVIYAYDVEGNFYAIDAATLVPTKLGALDLSVFYSFRDLAYDSVNGRMLAAITGMDGITAVYQVDMTSGLVTKLVEIYDGTYVEAITVGADGTVYVLDESFYPTQDIICKLDMQTGEKVMLNSLNRVSVYTSSQYPNAMITDPLTGMIYLMTTSNGNYNALTSFDPATNLFVYYGNLGETESVDDGFGWTELVGNTYNTIITLDTHEHLFAGEPVEVEDDCDHYMAVKQTCLLCGEITTVVNGHQYEFVETVAPDCVNGGYDHYECQCGLVEMRNPVAALGHTPDGVADCVTDVSCSVCGEVIEYAAGHDMVVNDPTLVCPGTYDATCSICGETGTVRLYGQHTVYVCAGTGYVYSGTCSICNATLSRTSYGRKVAVGHTNPNPDNMVDCTAGFDCSVCGQKVVEHNQHCYDRILEEDLCGCARTYACVRCEVTKEYLLQQLTLIAAPTTASVGELECVCDRCGDTNVVELPALNEVDYTCEVVQAPTATANGSACYTWNETFYGNMAFDVELPALNEDDYTYEVVLAPTATADGIGRYTWNQAIYGSIAFDVIIAHEVAETDAQIVIESNRVVVGNTLRLEVLLKNNPGIQGIMGQLKFDESVMTLVNVENGTLLTDLDVGINLLWSADAETMEDGVLCVLEFQIAENAPAGEYIVAFVMESVLDENEEPVQLHVVFGTVTVTNTVYGDVNGDGKVNLSDVLRLRKHLANRDPATGESTVVLGPQ